MAENNTRISDTGQAGFLLMLSVGSVVFAIGLSIFIFGATTTNVETMVDKIAVVLVGVVLMAGGGGTSYSALS